MIRRAEKRDIGKINDLLLQVLTVHHNGRSDIFKEGCRKYTDDQLEIMINDDSKPIFVYEEDEEVLGYAFTIFQQHLNDNILTDIKTLYIDDLCVDENQRGKGIGKKLYKHVLEFAKGSGCYNVTLNVWSFNEPAMKFYQSVGLDPLKVVMEKVL